MGDPWVRKNILGIIGITAGNYEEGIQLYHRKSYHYRGLKVYIDHSYA